jgi:prophage maintenance system killer protein
LKQAGQREYDNFPAGSYARRIFHRLLVDLSYHSSRLEGSGYSLLDTEQLLLHSGVAEVKLDKDMVIILNHKEAIRYLVDNAPHIEVSPNIICSLHFLLADGLVELDYAGAVRDHAVRIGGSTYIPDEGSRRLQAQLQAVIEQASKITDPFEQSFFLLVQIGYLQAFADVNKRTARCSANIPLIIHNLVPFTFDGIEINDYASAMIAIYELQDIRPLVDLYCYSYLRTCAAYDSTIEGVKVDWVRGKFHKQRRGLVREIIVGKLEGDQLNTHIRSQSERYVPEKERQLFIEDVQEDLSLMNQSRAAAFGISSDQLREWLAKCKQ